MKNRKKIIDLNAGHAEIESDEILYVYGNAYKVVLNESKLYQKIIKVGGAGFFGIKDDPSLFTFS